MTHRLMIKQFLCPCLLSEPRPCLHSLLWLAHAPWASFFEASSTAFTTIISSSTSINSTAGSIPLARCHLEPFGWLTRRLLLLRRARHLDHNCGGLLLGLTRRRDILYNLLRRCGSPILASFPAIKITPPPPPPLSSIGREEETQDWESWRNSKKKRD